MMERRCSLTTMTATEVGNDARDDRDGDEKNGCGWIVYFLYGTKMPRDFNLTCCALSTEFLNWSYF